MEPCGGPPAAAFSAAQSKAQADPPANGYRKFNAKVRGGGGVARHGLVAKAHNVCRRHHGRSWAVCLAHRMLTLWAGPACSAKASLTVEPCEFCALTTILTARASAQVDLRLAAWALQTGGTDARKASQCF